MKRSAFTKTAPRFPWGLSFQKYSFRKKFTCFTSTFLKVIVAAINLPHPAITVTMRLPFQSFLQFMKTLLRVFLLINVLEAALLLFALLATTVNLSAFALITFLMRMSNFSWLCPLLLPLIKAAS